MQKNVWKIVLRSVAYVLCISICLSSNAQKVNYKNQDRGELEKQRTMLMAEIKETQAKLILLQKDKNATLAQLQALQAKLTARQALINNINKDISLLENNITKDDRKEAYSTRALEQLDIWKNKFC
jgi:peptidoglycan hydrolase CwlO-like protein